LKGMGFAEGKKLLSVPFELVRDSAWYDFAG
jgi:hypothetical protein